MHDANKESFLKKQLVALLKAKQVDRSQFYGAEYALGFLYYLNPFRWRCLNMVQEKWFEGFIITIILLNCLALAMYDVTCDDDCESCVAPPRSHMRPTRSLTRAALAQRVE